MIEPRHEVFQYYFHFIQERMNIFWKKIEGHSDRLTDDSILMQYKFTNVYRALDRVSQYLISHVIYNHEPNIKEEDILIRIIIFKIFNKIETWEYLKVHYGNIYYSSFDPRDIVYLLSELQQRKPIFSAAYMMTGTHSRYNHLSTKHGKWLQMVKDELIDEGVIIDVIKSKSLGDIYSLLRKHSFMGDFIAYQYATDLNYSSFMNHDEDTFVKAGIGAVRGIKKCFRNTEKKSYEDIIQHVKENFIYYQDKYGYTDFRPLNNRNLKLIDLQNCFCETDKYLRAKLPNLSVGNKRIKQKYTPKNIDINYYFPPKWKIDSSKMEMKRTIL